MKRYLVGLTDLREDYKDLFVNLLKQSGEYIRQVDTNGQSKDVTEELIYLLAQLEVYFFICVVLTFPETPETLDIHPTRRSSFPSIGAP
jgi:hypothetical protein